MEKYYEQIIRSYIRQNALQDCSICLTDRIDLNELCKYISAMANTAAVNQIPYYYAFWGIDTESKSVVGSDFNIPSMSEIRLHLSNNANFDIKDIDFEQKRMIVLEVRAAFGNTIQCDGEEYALQNDLYLSLKDNDELAKPILDVVYSPKRFETANAMENISAHEIEIYLDCRKLFSMLETPYPNRLLDVIDVLTDLRFITEENTGKYNITNLGALLLARRLSQFKTVEYKAVRVLIYEGNNYTSPAHEQIGGKGYIVGFEGLIKYIEDHIPRTEYIAGALRKYKPKFPILSIRELVANAIIHQDLNEKGSPIISIFNDHIVISNPGKPVIDKERFIDSPPKSRNESLAAAMHRVGICEERGSGYDKVISFAEDYNLPAPEIVINSRSTAVTLRAEKNFEELTKEELVQICYSHTCLNYVQGKITNNTSLRDRLNLQESERYKVSRIFDATVEAGLIYRKEGTGPKNREYIPSWA